jgi:Tol biopolymer transport system component
MHRNGTRFLIHRTGAPGEELRKQEEKMKRKRIFLEFKKSGPALLVVGMLALLTTLTRPVRATFPGRNGRIAFVQQFPGLNGSGGDIYTVNPDGSDLKQLTSLGSSGTGAYYATWSSDGRYLTFQIFNPNTQQGQLWLMNADGSNQHLLFNDPLFSDFQPTFSPDGSHIVFTRCGGAAGNCAIYRVKSDGTGLTALTPFDINPDMVDFNPVYSPDGSTIAFASQARGGILASVYLMNANGSNIRPLTTPALEGWLPDWSPDGQRLAFTTNFIGGVLDEEIWTINADGTQPTRLTSNNTDYQGYLSGPHDSAPSWSPEGDAIVFERDAPDFSSSAIYIMNTDGTGESMVLQGIGRRTPKIPPRRGYGAGKPGQDRLELLEQGGTFPRWGAATN